MLFVLGDIDSCRGILVCSGCDNCNEWFHGHCINITEKMAKAIQEWYCMSCRGQRFSFSVAVVSSCKNNNNKKNPRICYLHFLFPFHFDTFWTEKKKTRTHCWKSNTDPRKAERRSRTRTEPSDSTARRARRTTEATDGADLK